MHHYVAIITREARGRPYEVAFPACPGCVTVGDTLEEALANAGEALEGWIETSAEAGDAVPPPAIAADVERHIRRGAFVTLVGVEPPVPKVVPVTFTIREDQLRLIDARAKEIGLSRSAFLAQSATGAASISSPIGFAPRKASMGVGKARSGRPKAARRK